MRVFHGTFGVAEADRERSESHKLSLAIKQSCNFFLCNMLVVLVKGNTELCLVGGLHENGPGK